MREGWQSGDQLQAGLRDGIQVCAFVCQECFQFAKDGVSVRGPFELINDRLHADTTMYRRNCGRFLTWHAIGSVTSGKALAAGLVCKQCISNSSAKPVYFHCCRKWPFRCSAIHGQKHGRCSADSAAPRTWPLHSDPLHARTWSINNLCINVRTAQTI